MLPLFKAQSEPQEQPDSNSEAADDGCSESGSDGEFGVTEEEIVKGRSTVNDITVFLQQMRCSEEPCAEDEADPQVKARTYSSAERAQIHWRRSIAKVLATVRLTRSIRKRQFQPRDFEKVGLVGKGSMASVYLVRMKGTEKLYAMKVLRKKDYPTKRAVQRAIAEREVLLMCNHPFITDLYFAFQTERHLYLVLEYCSGGDLSTLVQRLGRPLSEQELRFYICEIILALEYLHASGVIYRDLKPQNVLIHRSGHVRLADFSIATAGEVDTFTPEQQEKRKKRAHQRFDSRSKRVAATQLASSPVPSHKFIEGWDVFNDRPSEPAKSPPSSRPATPKLFGKGADNNGPSDCNSDVHTVSGSERMSEGAFVMQSGERLSEPHIQMSNGPARRGRRRSWIARLLRRPLVEGGSEADTEHQQQHQQRQQPQPKPTRSATNSPAKGLSEGGSVLDKLKAKLVRTPVSKYKQGRAAFGVDVKHHSNSLVGTVEYMAPEVVLGHEQGAEIDWWSLGVLSYELLLMETPFYASTRREVFVNILQSEPVFYHPMRQLSEPCISLLRGLLQKAPAARLGSEGRVTEIKQHPFFKNVHWALIANETPPFEPQEHGPLFSVGDLNNVSSVSRSDAEDGSSNAERAVDQPRLSNVTDEDKDRTVKKSKALIENRRPSLFEDMYDLPAPTADQPVAARQSSEEQDRLAELTGEVEVEPAPAAVRAQAPRKTAHHQHRRSLSENLHELRDPFGIFDSPVVPPTTTTTTTPPGAQDRQPAP